MVESNANLKHKHKASSNDIWRYVKAIGIPVILFMLSIFCISRFAGFGTSIIAPFTGVMWGCGVICGLLLPSHRSSILNETHVTIGVYLISLVLLKFVISLVSGVSSEMLMATYNQALPVTSGTAFSGTLQTMLWIAAILTPIGFIGMEVKKVWTFKRKATKAKTMKQIRDLRE